MFEKLFGQQNCSYNVHIVSSYLLSIRHHGPLTFTSAFAFESFYGEMRNNFVPKTISPLKQIMQNILMKRKLAPHVCKPPIFLSNYTTSLEDNSLIYTYKHGEHYLYEIVEVQETELICKEIDKIRHKFTETQNLNWSTVGVFKRGNTSSNTVTMQRTDVKGKLIAVQELLITCPNNILQEK